MTGVPPAVLVARLENELESARLAVKQPNYITARDAVDRAIDLAKQLRGVL